MSISTTQSLGQPLRTHGFYEPEPLVLAGSVTNATKALDLSNTLLPVADGIIALMEHRYEDVLNFVDDAENNYMDHMIRDHVYVRSDEDKFILNAVRELAFHGIAARAAAENRDGKALHDAIEDSHEIYSVLHASGLPGAQVGVDYLAGLLQGHLDIGVKIDLPVADGVSAFANGEYQSIIDFEGQYLTDADEDILADLKSLAQIGLELRALGIKGDSDEIVSLTNDADNILDGLEIDKADKNTISDSLKTETAWPVKVTKEPTAARVTELPIEAANQALLEGNTDDVLKFTTDKLDTTKNPKLSKIDEIVLEAYQHIAVLLAQDPIPNSDINRVHEMFTLLDAKGVRGADAMASHFELPDGSPVTLELSITFQDIMEKLHDTDFTERLSESPEAVVTELAVARATELPIEAGNQALLEGNPEDVLKFTTDKLDATRNPKLSKVDEVILETYQYIAILLAQDPIPNSDISRVNSMFTLLGQKGVRDADIMASHYVLPDDSFVTYEGDPTYQDLMGKLNDTDFTEILLESPELVVPHDYYSVETI
ncbi:MAG: hypothetical protein V3U76_05850 [Granulosicoccus sp.]